MNLNVLFWKFMVMKYLIYYRIQEHHYQFDKVCSKKKSNQIDHLFFYVFRKILKKKKIPLSNMRTSKVFENETRSPNDFFLYLILVALRLLQLQLDLV